MRRRCYTRPGWTGWIVPWLWVLVCGRSAGLRSGARVIPSTGAKIAGTGASLAGIGTVAWTNPGNITASDNTRATSAVGSGGVSNWLVATNFDFSTIPNDAIILGVIGTVEASYVSGTKSTLTAASFVVGDAVVGTQKTLAQDVTTSDVSYTVGSVSDLWGYAITPVILKASTTGWALSMTGTGGLNSARVDAMWMTVTYMVAGRTLRTRRVRRTNRH